MRTQFGVRKDPAVMENGKCGRRLAPVASGMSIMSVVEGEQTVNTRRQVIRWIAAVAGTLVGVLPKLRRQAVAQEAEPEFEKVGTLADLEENQLLLEEGFSGGPVLLIRTEAEEAEGSEEEAVATLVALNPTCSHRGCTVDLNDGQLVCPCHGATYDLEGKVTRGPAREDLGVYQVRLEDEDILLAVEA